MKKHKIVLLPSRRSDDNLYKEIRIFKDAFLKLNLYSSPIFEVNASTPQHLYIISNDEIKVGDWFIHSTPEMIWSEPNKCEKVNGNYVEGDIVFGVQGEETGCKKIIASTDKLITPKSFITDLFINTYIKAYNESKTIEEVESNNVHIIIHTPEIYYVVITKLPIEQQAPFKEWLRYQTIPCVESEGDDKMNCAYKWDYDKWLDSWNKGENAIIED
jgi:hypothetical protein